MEDRNISHAALARAVRMSKKAIQNILNKVSQPYEDNLVRIAAVLGVKWRTLVEGYEGDPQDAAPPSGVVAGTTVDILVNIRNDDIRDAELVKLLMDKLTKAVGIADVIRVVILRDKP
jgi:transcriptional regulator with XRE-family HTH domain